MGAMFGHRVGVGLGVVIFIRSTGRLGDERADSHVAGLVGELRKLLVDDTQLLAKSPQAHTDLLEASFEQPISHGRSLGSDGGVDMRARLADVHDEWGITDGFFDVAGAWHPTSDDTRERLRTSMGSPIAGPPLWFVPVGAEHALWNPCRLVLEDGTDRGDIGELPGDLPIGYHDLTPRGGGPTTRLVIHPTSCPPIPEAWGISAQIYSLWSERSWGIGDLADLATVAAKLVQAGGRAVLVSPLHQPAPSLPQEDSPYYPSSRRAWNPLLIGFEEPPASHLICEPGELIDRNEAWMAKRVALEEVFAKSTTLPALADLVAVWNALCDEYGPVWQSWPEVLSRCDREAVADKFRDDPTFARRAVFHQWCQLVVGEQLERVSSTGIRLVGDLALGFSPHGADAWEFQELLALDLRIGAPPDPFSEHGQEWGIPPFVPWRLRNALYEPFIATLRASLRGVHGLRIDHVMGLFRQFWIPAGEPPATGAYVHLPADEMLALVCLEVTRAGAFVVGEDLGTVEPRVRERLSACSIASTKVLWFEDQHPGGWATNSLATITTHDLPTITGVFNGTDGDAQQRHRLAAVTAADTAEQAVAAVHAALLRSPASLRLMSMDDLCAATERPNHPGTTEQPNWRRRLPLSIDDVHIPSPL